jgi:hypothetical protein
MDDFYLIYTDDDVLFVFIHAIHKGDIEFVRLLWKHAPWYVQDRKTELYKISLNADCPEVLDILDSTCSDAEFLLQRAFTARCSKKTLAHIHKHLKLWIKHLFWSMF